MKRKVRASEFNFNIRYRKESQFRSSRLSFQNMVRTAALPKISFHKYEESLRCLTFLLVEFHVWPSRLLLSPPPPSPLHPVPSPPSPPPPPSPPASCPRTFSEISLCTGLFVFEGFSFENKDIAFKFVTYLWLHADHETV